MKQPRSSDDSATAHHFSTIKNLRQLFSDAWPSFAPFQTLRLFTLVLASPRLAASFIFRWSITDALPPRNSRGFPQEFRIHLPCPSGRQSYDRPLDHIHRLLGPAVAPCIVRIGGAWTGRRAPGHHLGVSKPNSRQPALDSADAPLQPAMTPWPASAIRVASAAKDPPAGWHPSAPARCPGRAPHIHHWPVKPAFQPCVPMLPPC